MKDDITCDVTPPYIVFMDSTFMKVYCLPILTLSLGFSKLVVGEERGLGILCSKRVDDYLQCTSWQSIKCNIYFEIYIILLGMKINNYF